MGGKIGLEEHFNLQEFADGHPQYVKTELMREVNRRLLDLTDQRLADMDAAGIDYSLLSLTAPGVQAVAETAQAVDLAQATNDQLAEIVAANPTRFGGFATVALQDPAAATTELERCVTQLGFHGVMINGFTNAGDADTGWYYDHERFAPFWECLEGLSVPAYLHPRISLEHNRGLIEGHPELENAAWEFGVETATHALRLMTSGLFDRFPKLTVILGHLGEALPLTIWRVDHRAPMSGRVKFNEPLTSYLLNNFYVTTSGNFHTRALNAAVAEMGVDRVLYSTDYPYESMQEASGWFDNAQINENDRAKIGYWNARSLFPHIPEKIGRP